MYFNPNNIAQSTYFIYVISYSEIIIWNTWRAKLDKKEENKKKFTKDQEQSL
ncbi:MAG: hypothetical protein Ta2E_04840 [Mycoplasmoidaceae bacterium]|nr:MAG: hypothetical protein Ta2E_04840 [Mycoplasmoidaceae bacterium]